MPELPHENCCCRQADGELTCGYCGWGEKHEEKLLRVARAADGLETEILKKRYPVIGFRSWDEFRSALKEVEDLL